MASLVEKLYNIYKVKITYTKALFDKLIIKLDLPEDFTGNIVLAYWNHPKLYYWFKERYPNAKVVIVEDAHLKQLYNINEQDCYYVDLEKEAFPQMTLTNPYIIANVPYGSIGANIADYIREHVDYAEFINLLPANDYKRNKDKDLFNYQSDMEVVSNGFADAAVTTHLARIHKNKVNNLTEAEFESSQYTDPSLALYFTQQIARAHYAIDNAKASAPKNLDADTSKMIFINHRDTAHKHLAYTKNCAAYKINVEGWTYAQAAEKFGLVNDKSGRIFDGGVILFDTKEEKQYCSQFIYSPDGFRFIAKVLTATNTDSWLDIKKWLPKVSWTRPWTVKEILLEYGYTVGAANEVIASLTNFKGLKN